MRSMKMRAMVIWWLGKEDEEEKGREESRVGLEQVLDSK